MFGIKEARIHNFVKIKDQVIPLWDLGLVWLRGRNMDEPKGMSGAGKTLLGDAIHWLLGGKTTRGIKANKVIGKFDKWASVEASIISHGTDYELGRYRNHPKLKDHISVYTGQDVSKRVLSKNEESIEKILGCSFNMFQLSSFLTDDENSHFSRMDGGPRGMILDEIANTKEADAPNRMHKVNNMIRDLEKEILNIDSEEAVLKGSLSSDKDAIRILTANYEKEKSRDSLNESSLISRITKLREPKVDEHQKWLDYYSAQYAHLQQEKELLKDQADDKQNKIYITERNIAVIESNIRGCDKGLEQLKTPLPIEKEIGVICKTCGNKVTKDSIANLKSGDSDRVKQRMHEKGVYLKSLVLAKEELHRANSIKVTQFDTGKEIKTLRDIEFTKSTIRGIEAGYIEADNLQRQLDETKGSRENHLSVLKNQIDQKNLEISNNMAKLKNIFYLRLNKQKRVEKLKFLSDFYSPQGFRPIVMGYYAPVVSQASNYFLADFTGGKERVIVSTRTETAKGDIREKVDINVMQGSEVKSFPNEFCKGENGAIDISMDFGIMRLSGQNSGNDSGFMFLDEITNSLSSVLIERLFHVIREKVYKKGMTIIVTTHHPVPESLFDHVWVSVKEKDVCRIEFEK